MRMNYNFDVFIYYGIILDRSVAHEVALMNGHSTIYDFVEACGLSYQMVGNIGYTDSVIIGKQLHWDYGSHITELSFEDNNIELKSKLHANEQEHIFKNNMESSYEDIKKLIRKFGVNEVPKHYIITNYGKM